MPDKLTPSFSQMNISISDANLIRIGLMGIRLCILLTLATTWIQGTEPERLTSVTAVRALTTEEGSRKLLVRLEGVVTFYHPDWGVLFIHDGEQGICVGVPVSLRPKEPYAVGTRLGVDGVVGPGEFLPVIWPDAIQVLGSGKLPNYENMSAETLFQPSRDCAPVEVSAIVKGTSFAEQSLVVDLQIDGQPIKALIPQSGTLTQLPWQLLERRVRVRGVAGTHFNDQRQMSGRLLYVPDLNSLSVQEEEPLASDVRLVPIDGLLRVDSALRQRVRVQGVATHVLPGRGLYLRGEGGSLFVQTAQPFEIARGAHVEAEGYPVAIPFRPSLSALDVKKTGEGAQLEPIAFDARAQRNSREQCELVSLDAEFLELTPGRDSSTLICRAEGEVFESFLPSSWMPPEELSPGMKLRLTGICELISTRPLVIPRTATGFRILLRDSADILITARQPWWNERRALWVLGILGAAAIAIAAWAIALQFIVGSQSNLIRQQAEQQATLEERQRIARDLHDTLEQELVGVNMLLDSTAMKLNGNHPEATEPLALARRLLRRAREESRTTIRELRSVALEQRGLPAALDELLRPLATVGGAQFSVEILGQPFRLAGTLETNLLRIAQEAVANAARHSEATQILLRLEYSPERIRLEIEDNGIGFDTAGTISEPGHFGLSGMRERTEKISGELDLRSSKGAGTTVLVTAPAISVNLPLPAQPLV